MILSMVSNSPPSDDLEALSPEEAVEMYLDHRSADLAEKTLQNQRYRLTRFLEWCEETGLENMNTLTGRQLHQYRSWRNQEVKRVTLVNELRTLQKFLEFCATIDGVEPGMRERVLIPDLKPGDEAKEIELESDRAEAILEHLERFAYASREHVILALLWHTGMRLGTLRALDVDDFDQEARMLRIRHRPESETPLKNNQAAERSINVSEHYCQVLIDYIETNRHDVTDEYGREPLITSTRGRLTATPIRQLVYKVTQPCHIGECPHDKHPSTCEWRQRDHRRGCPSSRSPHAVRRGSITHHLREGAPQQVVQERVNVSSDVLDTHYDERTEREKAETRRRWLSDVFEEGHG